MLKDDILKLHNEGKRNCEIAKALKCCRNTIVYHLNPEVREKRKAKSKQYMKDNYKSNPVFRAKIIASNTKCVAKHRKAGTSWAQLNRDKNNECQRRWRENNPDKCKQYYKKYYNKKRR